MEDIAAGRLPALFGADHFAVANQGNTANTMQWVDGQKLRRTDVPEEISTAFPREHYVARVNGLIFEVMGPGKTPLRSGDEMTRAPVSIISVR